MIKAIVTPIAILAMKMSFPSDNESTETESVDSIIAKETKYTDIDNRKKQRDSWFNEHPYPTEEKNPYVVTDEELEFWNEYNAEKQKEFELNSGLGGNYSNVEDEVSKKFGDKFGTLYEQAIKNFIGGCIVKPVGGPGSVSKTLSIKSDLQKCGEESFRETFLGESDDKNIAKTFGDEFANGCYAEHENQVTMWAVIPAAPPVMPVTPGGPIIAVPSVSIIPVMFKALKSALEKTFPDGSGDSYNIANKFASKLSTAGIIMGTYALTCKCPPGGGPIIVS